MAPRPLTALCLLALCTWADALTPGGGSAVTDCLAEFGGTPANWPPGGPRDVRCVDDDPACDDDPLPGICRFRVEVCLNVTDPALPACAPADLDGYFVENEQPDTNPLHDFDFQTLQERLTFLTLPVEAGEPNVCSGEVLMSVRLSIRPRTGGASYRRGRKTLRATVSGPGGVADEDRLRLGCVPADGTSPCDGVTSTFQQIQDHLFTPTCARSTCHNVAQGAHDLSLSPGEAYANLVGIPPANEAAAAAGRLRVDPGNPANSFILAKLRGELASGEGERMPLGLKRLQRLHIRLIEEWITAGAPETGLVAAVGCQAPSSLQSPR